MKTKTKLNFHKHTYCEFEKVEITFFKNKVAHYKSKSGSLYLYSEKGVYRYSNHWGRVANCRWKIKGIEDYKNQNYFVGYAKWSNFHSLNSTDKTFYIELAANGEAKIISIKDSVSNEPFLMTLDFAFKRLKQLKVLYKDYKWATYYHENVHLARNILTEKLINSDKTLQELKQSLKNEFD